MIESSHSGGRVSASQILFRASLRRETWGVSRFLRAWYETPWGRGALRLFEELSAVRSSERVIGALHISRIRSASRLGRTWRAGDEKCL